MRSRAEFALIVCIALGCKPKVGASCVVGKDAPACLDEGHAAVCGADSKWVVRPVLRARNADEQAAFAKEELPNGCHPGSKGTPLVEVGDPCTAIATCSTGLASTREHCGPMQCSTDRKRLLECVGHSFVVFKACPGCRPYGRRNIESSMPADWFACDG